MSQETPAYRSFVITSVVEETVNVKSFGLKPADGEAVSYEAGQFITLVFRKGTREDRRSYSFSSSPLLGEPMRITVKRIPNGEYSRKLWEGLEPGDILISSGISGFFRLPAQTEDLRQFVFLAAGSGITPVYSLLKTLLHTTDLSAVLIYSNYSEEETIFHKELTDLAEQYPGRLTIEFLFSRSDREQRRLSKFLLLTLLDRHQIPLKETMFYLCGPESYMLVAEISLITAGVSRQRIRKENFNARPRTSQPVPPDTDAHQVRVLVKEEWHEFTVQYPDTILSAAKKIHLPLPYSCEAGSCGSCAATCIQGIAWMARNEVLMDEEIRQGKVLTCQAFPVGGDVVLEL